MRTQPLQKNLPAHLRLLMLPVRCFIPLLLYDSNFKLSLGVCLCAMGVASIERYNIMLFFSGGKCFIVPYKPIRAKAKVNFSFGRFILPFVDTKPHPRLIEREEISETGSSLFKERHRLSVRHDAASFSLFYRCAPNP